VVAVAIVVGVVVGSSLGGSTDSPSTPATTSSKASSTTAGRSGLVRNATPQADWKPHAGPVPILEYHVLGAAPADAPYPELYVTRPDFHQQMDWLDAHEYEAVTLEMVEDAWYHGGTLPAKPVVLSFDDGYRPQFTFALPELRRHGWAGLLNLKAEGSDLYESNVEAMIAAGWQLASHTIDHSDLTTLSGASLVREVAESRQILRREYGVPVESFCYPAGRFDHAGRAGQGAARPHPGGTRGRQAGGDRQSRRQFHHQPRRLVAPAELPRQDARGPRGPLPGREAAGGGTQAGVRDGVSPTRGCSATSTIRNPRCLWRSASRAATR